MILKLHVRTLPKRAEHLLNLYSAIWAAHVELVQKTARLSIICLVARAHFEFWQRILIPRKFSHLPYCLVRNPVRLLYILVKSPLVRCTTVEGACSLSWFQISSIERSVLNDSFSHLRSQRLKSSVLYIPYYFLFLSL